VIQQPKVSKKITEAIDTKDEPFIKKKESPQHSGWMSKKVAKLPQVVETEVKPVKTIVTNKATGITYELTAPVKKAEIVQKVVENVQPAEETIIGDMVRDALFKDAGVGKQGLSVQQITKEYVKGVPENYTIISYRSPKGEPIAAVQLNSENKVFGLALDKSKGLLSGKAFKVLKQEAEKRGVTDTASWLATSKEAKELMNKITKGKPAKTEKQQETVIKTKKPKDSGSASIYDYVKENEPQSVIVQSKPPVLPRIVQQEATDEIKKMTGGKGTLISTEPITHPESPVSRAFETLAKDSSEPKTIADMPEIQTSPYTSMKVMPPIEKVERLEPMVKTSEKFRDLSEKIKERYQKYPASAVMSEYYLRNVPIEVEQGLVSGKELRTEPSAREAVKIFGKTGKLPDVPGAEQALRTYQRTRKLPSIEPVEEPVEKERISLPKNLPEAIYNIQVKQPMKVVKPEPLMTTATGGLVKGVRSLGDVYPEGSQVEYSKEGKRVKGIIKGHDIDALSKKMGETTLNTLKIQNPQGEMEDVRLSQGNFKLINKPEKVEKPEKSEVLEQFEKRKPKKEKLPPSVTDYAHTLRAAQKISEPAFVEPRMPKPVRMPRKLKELPVLEETPETQPPSSEFMAEVNMGSKKMKKKDNREKVSSRRIKDKKGWTTRKLKNIPLLKRTYDTKEGSIKRAQPMLDSDLTRTQQRSGEKIEGMKLKTASYPQDKTLMEMKTREQNIEAEAEARNKKAEEFVKGERERSKAETKKLTESVVGIQKSQKEQTKEEAKEAKRQAVLDTFLMGKGTYNKSIANAIQTADESRRIFAEVDRRKREKEQAVALQEQAKEQKIQQKHQAAVELAGGERQLSQAQKEMQKYAKEKFKYLRHKRKQDIERWKVRERPAVVRWATTRKKGKLGTSRVGNVIHSILYPVKPRKKRRW
jgi:hypothetical protein